MAFHFWLTERTWFVYFKNPCRGENISEASFLASSSNCEGDADVAAVGGAAKWNQCERADPAT